MLLKTGEMKNTALCPGGLYRYTNKAALRNLFDILHRPPCQEKNKQLSSTQPGRDEWNM